MVALIERYRERLPVSEATPVVSLGEGSTPLLLSRRLSERYGAHVYLKCEGANPTGSFKDRGMTVAISKALEEGVEAVICASTGNTASSAAAYAARAGIPAVILQPEGAVAAGKLAQTRMHTARLFEVRGSFDDALAAARDLAARGSHALVNSLNPHRREGQKTAVYELADELGRLPGAIYLPYGGGGNTAAYGQALVELGSSTTRLVAAEPADRAKTVASALRIVRPAHADAVRSATESSDGVVVALDDAAIVGAWRDLAGYDGVFCEPASASAVAALDADPPQPGATVVCVLTGHGLKDAESASHYGAPVMTVDADPDSIAAAAAASGR